MSWFRDVSRVPAQQIDWDAVKQQSRELNGSDAQRIVSQVPKFTPVKEGQQHPVGKHGQLKLFHEHVWPKGYTPQRMRDVVDATAGFVNAEDGSHTSGHVQNKIVESMARSTVPVDTLRDLATNASIVVSPDTAVGEFNHDDMEIRINPNALKADYSGTVINQATMHELGHLHDYLSDFDDYHKNNDNRHWYGSARSGHMASPALEGRAEGFRLATSRITRGMKRGNEAQLAPTAMYNSTQFPTPEAKSIFRLNRLKSFRASSGFDPYPRITETQISETPHEQLRIPGVD